MVIGEWLTIFLASGSLIFWRWWLNIFLASGSLFS